ncbi:MAG: ABC transporter permease [Spirochaetes bacterium]|nr:MAG: ABC transporter permease [Spirochaetota bacterium]
MERFVRAAILKSMLVKEFKQVFRDRRMVGVLFASPVFMLLIFGYAVITDVKDIRMAVLDRDRSSESRAFVEKFTASGYFLPYAYADSEKMLENLMDTGQIDLFLHIEEGFEKNVRAGRGAGVQLVLDGSDSVRASVAMSYVNAIAGDYSMGFLEKNVRAMIAGRGAAGVRFKQQVELKERALFNPDLASRNFYLPGILGLLITLISIMLTSMAVVKEREIGTIEQITVSPLRPAEFIVGKMLPFAIVSFVDIIVITMVAIGYFGVPFNGSFLFLLFASAFFIMCNLAVGLFISTISRTQQQAVLSTFLFFLPAILFSGFMFPIYAMPPVIQVVTFADPLRYFIDIIRGVFLKGVGPAHLWHDVVALFVLGSIMLFFAVRRFKRGMD